MRKNKHFARPALPRGRPPIVAVLGHVDHGKTTLLDFIRKTRVALREAGGITQKIGAYQVEVDSKKITFIDTPGHQAFSKMRSRGAKVADLVVLVVAADDGVMPQTLESLEHIRTAEVPFLVAINKIDIAGTDPEKIKKQLADNGIKIEGHGGDIVCVPVSAKTGQGVKDLLEMILLLAEMEEIKGSIEGPLEAVMIESKMEKGGPVGTMIVKNGTLKIGEQILVENVPTKVRGILNENGKNQTLVQPGQPVEVIGFESVPPIGAKVTKAEEVISKETPVQKTEKIEIPDEAKDKLKIILRADSKGSLEAVKESLPESVFVVFSGVGDILESDIFLAQTVGAEIVGFNVRASSETKKLGETEKVKIKIYKIIYELLEELEKESLGEISEEKEILGKAVILKEFEIGGSRIAGCRVLEGRINQADRIILQRGEREIGKTKISSMKHQKTEISESRQNEEFGAIFSSPLDFKVGDMLISFAPAEKK